MSANVQRLKLRKLVNLASSGSTKTTRLVIAGLEGDNGVRRIPLLPLLMDNCVATGSGAFLPFAPVTVALIFLMVCPFCCCVFFPLFNSLDANDFRICSSLCSNSSFFGGTTEGYWPSGESLKRFQFLSLTCPQLQLNLFN